MRTMRKRRSDIVGGEGVIWFISAIAMAMQSVWPPCVFIL
jgi:hypothetical protein